MPIIEILHGGYMAPLTKLDFASTSTAGRFDGGAYYPDRTVCNTSRQIKDSYINVPKPFTKDDPFKELSGKHVFGGLLQNEHFGHFCAESLSRVWALSKLSPSFNSIIFYLRVPTQPIRNFVFDFFRALDPDLKISFVSDFTRIEELAIPEQLGHSINGFIYGHPAVREGFKNLRTFKRGGINKVYVSRTGLKNNEGGVLLERVIEANLEDEGYLIIHPEKLSIREQLEIYNSADKLIFSDGSALHLYAFVARPEQKAFTIWRRKRNETFAWQVRSFGGPELTGTASVRKLYVPQGDGITSSRAQALIDFIHLRDQLKELGYIIGSSWDIPTEEEFEIGLEKLSQGMTSPYNVYNVS